MFLLLPMTPLFAYLLDAYLIQPVSNKPHKESRTHPVKHKPNTSTNPAVSYAFLSERMLHQAEQ
jgi:hypothetical protein